jgi:hypothetical protein
MRRLVPSNSVFVQIRGFFLGNKILTATEQILSDIAYHKIEIYRAPQYEKEDDETIAENEEIEVCFPVFLRSHHCKADALS